MRRLGTYQMRIEHRARQPVGRAARRLLHGQELPEKVTGHFRVEAFRVPTDEGARLTPVETPLVNADAAELDVQRELLPAAAAGGQAVKLRGLVQPMELELPGLRRLSVCQRPGARRPGATWRRAGILSRLRAGRRRRETAADGPEDMAMPGARPLATQSVTLDSGGAARVRFDRLPAVTMPQTLQAELEYARCQRRNPHRLDPRAAAAGEAWSSDSSRTRGQPPRTRSASTCWCSTSQGRPRRRRAGQRGAPAAQGTTRTASAWWAASTPTSTTARSRRLKQACARREPTRKGLLVLRSRPRRCPGNLIAAGARRRRRRPARPVHTATSGWPARTNGGSTPRNDDRMDVLPENASATSRARRRDLPGAHAVPRGHRPGDGRARGRHRRRS
ncbi:MAG: hypothetical protein MZV65_37445 [Chromatiales bacterium]|nr:hypothetical protein [Chromatiales bacterium]